MHLPRIPALLLLLTSAALLTACGDKEAKWLGKYTSNKEKLVLNILPTHKATFGPPAGPAMDITWEITADDKITVQITGMTMNMFRQPDGSLTDGEGTTWKKN